MLGNSPAQPTPDAIGPKPNMTGVSYFFNMSADTQLYSLQYLPSDQLYYWRAHKPSRALALRALFLQNHAGAYPYQQRWLQRQVDEQDEIYIFRQIWPYIQANAEPNTRLLALALSLNNHHSLAPYQLSQIHMGLTFSHTCIRSIVTVYDYCDLASRQQLLKNTWYHLIHPPNDIRHFQQSLKLLYQLWPKIEQSSQQQLIVSLHIMIDKVRHRDLGRALAFTRTIWPYLTQETRQDFVNNVLRRFERFVTDVSKQLEEQSLPQSKPQKGIKSASIEELNLHLTQAMEWVKLFFPKLTQEQCDAWWRQLIHWALYGGNASLRRKSRHTICQLMTHMSDDVFNHLFQALQTCLANQQSYSYQSASILLTNLVQFEAVVSSEPWLEKLDESIQYVLPKLIYQDNLIDVSESWQLLYHLIPYAKQATRNIIYQQIYHVAFQELSALTVSSHHYIKGLLSIIQPLFADLGYPYQLELIKKVQLVLGQQTPGDLWFSSMKLLKNLIEKAEGPILYDMYQQFYQYTAWQYIANHNHNSFGVSSYLNNFPSLFAKLNETQQATIQQWIGDNLKKEASSQFWALSLLKGLLCSSDMPNALIAQLRTQYFEPIVDLLTSNDAHCQDLALEILVTYSQDWDIDRQLALLKKWDILKPSLKKNLKAKLLVARLDLNQLLYQQSAVTREELVTHILDLADYAEDELLSDQSLWSKLFAQLHTSERKDIVQGLLNKLQNYSDSEQELGGGILDIMTWISPNLTWKEKSKLYNELSQYDWSSLALSDSIEVLARIIPVYKPQELTQWLIQQCSPDIIDDNKILKLLDLLNEMPLLRSVLDQAQYMNLLDQIDYMFSSINAQSEPKTILNSRQQEIIYFIEDNSFYLASRSQSSLIEWLIRHSQGESMEKAACQTLFKLLERDDLTYELLQQIQQTTQRFRPFLLTNINTEALLAALPQSQSLNEERAPSTTLG